MTPEYQEQVDLRQRCPVREFMDEPGIGDAEIHQALRELRVINRSLGGVATSLAGLTPHLRARRSPARILDIGTGGGDLPVAIARWCRKKGVPVRIVAVDVGAAACRFARATVGDYPEIEVARADVRTLPFPPRSFDLAHCAMFLHHFDQEEAIDILRSLAVIVTEGIVINDLHRHPVAYHSIRFLTRLFSRSRLVRNDAPLSVRRGFRPSDLDEIGKRCNVSGFRYRWAWAFRYLCEVDVRLSDSNAGLRSEVDAG